MRIVVCDTGPLLHLSEANLLEILQLAGEIIIPPSVVKEYQRNRPQESLPDWIRVENLDEKYSLQAQELRNSIDWGESEAIAIAQQVKADWLLSDDAKARQLAESLGIEVHGSLGLLLWGMVVGHIRSREAAIDALSSLSHSSLWLSERVLHKAHQAIDEIFSQ